MDETEMKRLKLLINNFLALFMLIICSSCFQEVIDIDTSGIDEQIVIEGVVSDGTNPNKVIVSKVSDIYNFSGFERVSGATVFISDDRGNGETLSEVEAGIYQTEHLQGSPGRTYTLNVNVDGKTYTAFSTMPAAIGFDSIRTKQIAPNDFAYELHSYFKDRPGEDDYCRIKYYVNGQEWYQVLYHDEFTDGKVIKVFNEYAFYLLNDFVEIELFTIEKPVFEYLSVLLNVNDSENNNSEVEQMFELASANPKSNISNNALGYFSAQTYRYYNVKITR